VGRVQIIAYVEELRSGEILPHDLTSVVYERHDILSVIHSLSVCQCLVMLQRWHRDPTSTADVLRDGLGAIGRRDVIARCMTDSQVPEEDGDRQQAISSLIHRVYIALYTICFRVIL